MLLETIDWVIISIFFAIVLGIGWVASLTAGKSSEEFFLGGREMPWWLLGISMVACTFSADTPNLVTGFVRENGVSKNWAWWAFLITGMVTVFIYKETAHPDVNLIFGAVIDQSLKDEVHITVIATGFERTGVPRWIVEPAATEVHPSATPASIPVGQPAREFQPRAFNTEDLDIPTFLRNRGR